MNQQQRTRSVTVETPDERSIVLTRDFDASAEMLWRAHTEPDLVKRWLGRRAFPLTTCEIDLRVGGRYRYVWTRLDGSASMGAGGTYDEIERPVRMVTTESFDDFPGPGVNTLTIASRGGVSTLTIACVYPSREIRDGWLSSGMTDGMDEGYAALDEVLASMS